MMPALRAIGFDLFNTLITIHPQAIGEAQARLMNSLEENGIRVDAVAFRAAYVDAAKGFLREARKDGRETHNRFWIAAALGTLGIDLSPEDDPVAAAVETYFEAFHDHCHMVPETQELLQTLAKDYRLGLLSNFTHGPAARALIDKVNLTSFFGVILISGELGYRKPHPHVFDRFVAALGVPPAEILFVGDDPDADVRGAQAAGLRSVLTTCVQDMHIPNAQTVLSPDPASPPEGIPTISNWQDLLSLLP